MSQEDGKKIHKLEDLNINTFDHLEHFNLNNLYCLLVVIYFTKSGLITKPICDGNISSIEIYKECVEKENDIFNSNLTKKWQKRGKLPKLSSFDKFYLLNKYYIAHFVKPKNGSIKLSRKNTFGIGLHSNFEYIMEFHDKNYFIQSQNPAIIKKNMLMIKKNVFTFLYLKVNALLRGLYHKT